jgi:Na+-translocating ferredoxin:NAD+ oxidoreductase RNF subunit RnfB
MDSIILATAAVSVIGLLCAVMLATASKIMAVPVDERTGQIRSCLPGANCGACGYPGCDGYAAALTSGKGVATNLCIPGGDSCSKQISEVLGVAYEDVIEMVAVVKCSGTLQVTSNKMDYSGIQSCAAVKLFYGGEGACAYSCLGYGDCASVCPNNAVSVVDGVARVNIRLCVGCALCAKQCPKGIIAIVPLAKKPAVKCSNTDKGALTRAVCKGGCIGCGKCVKTCPEGAIALTNNLAAIDSNRCTGCGACVEGCPTHGISFI